jgi:hypothetical protein
VADWTGAGSQSLDWDARAGGGPGSQTLEAGGAHVARAAVADAAVTGARADSCGAWAPGARADSAEAPLGEGAFWVKELVQGRARRAAAAPIPGLAARPAAAPIPGLAANQVMVEPV